LFLDLNPFNSSLELLALLIDQAPDRLLKRVLLEKVSSIVFNNHPSWEFLQGEFLQGDIFGNLLENDLQSRVKGLCYTYSGP